MKTTKTKYTVITVLVVFSLISCGLAVLMTGWNETKLRHYVLVIDKGSLKDEALLMRSDVILTQNMPAFIGGWTTTGDSHYVEISVYAESKRFLNMRSLRLENEYAMPLSEMGNELLKQLKIQDDSATFIDRRDVPEHTLPPIDDYHDIP